MSSSLFSRLTASFQKGLAQGAAYNKGDNSPVEVVSQPVPATPVSPVVAPVVAPVAEPVVHFVNIPDTVEPPDVGKSINLNDTDIANDETPVVKTVPKPSLLDRVKSVGESFKGYVRSKIPAKNNDAPEVVADNVTSVEEVQKPSLLDRVKSVSKSLQDNVKNKTAADWGWMGATVAVGAAAKIGLFAAVGVTASGAVIPALALAAAGGAVVGVTRSGMEYLRASKTDKPTGFLFTKKTLMNATSGAAISAATFGVLTGAEHLSNVDLAEKVSGYLANIKNNFSFNLFGGGAAGSDRPNFVTGPITLNGVPVTTGVMIAEHDAAATVHAVDMAMEDARPAPAPKPPVERVVAAPAPVAQPEPVRAVVPEPEVVEPVQRVEMVDIPTVGAVTITVPAAPNIAEEFEIASNAAVVEHVNNQLSQQFVEKYGYAIPPEMNLTEVAYAVAQDGDGVSHVDNLKSSAPKLDIAQMAGACVADVPETPEAMAAAQNVVPVKCVSVKDDMEVGGFITLRDANVSEPNAQRGGLRVLFTNARVGVSSFIEQMIGPEGVPKLVGDAHNAQQPSMDIAK